VRQVRALARVPEKVRRMPNLLPGAGIVRVYPRSEKGKLVIVTPDCGLLLTADKPHYELRTNWEDTR